MSCEPRDTVLYEGQYGSVKIRKGADGKFYFVANGRVKEIIDRHIKELGRKPSEIKDEFVLALLADQDPMFAANYKKFKAAYSDEEAKQLTQQQIDILLEKPEQ